jgi:cob(I)alamin adenosyltransferase
MVRLDKIYTKAGDSGQTSLGDGKRVSKNSIRISSYGTVDELNAILGIVSIYCSKKIKKIILQIQNDLFDLGADLCIPDGQENKRNKVKRIKISNKQVTRLEKVIDEINKELEPLNSFILPGGVLSAAYLHHSRTVTRRAERLVVQLDSSNKGSINKNIIKYLNRLSDLLFVLARYENKKGKGDILWHPSKKIL